MGVILHSYSDYSTNCKGNSECQSAEDNLGFGHKHLGNLKVEGLPDTFWNDQVDSISISPSQAYEWCGYQHVNKAGDNKCYYTDTPRLEHINTYTDRTLKKMCDHEIHRWDIDCNKINPDPEITKENCNINSKCWEAQKSECKDANLANTRCKDWCIQNSGECFDSTIKNFCEKIDIDTMKVKEKICKNNPEITKNIINEKCSINNNVFPKTECQDYCTNDPENCRVSVQKYCNNNFDNYCKKFCENNIEICSAAIRNYCNSYNIKNDKWCADILTNKEFSDTHKNVMNEYCNNEGAQRNLKNINTSNLSSFDILENPICACLDNNLISHKFSEIKDQEIKNQFTLRPECFYKNCIDSKAFKPLTNQECNIKICRINLGNAIISNSNVQFRNDCGDGNEDKDKDKDKNKDVKKDDSTLLDKIKNIKFNELLDKIKNNKFNELVIEEKIIIIIGIVIICLLFYFLFSSSSKPKPNPIPYPNPYTYRYR
jgi:hypothetical protein